MRRWLMQGALCATVLLLAACQKVDRTPSGADGSSTPAAHEAVVVDTDGIEMVLIPAGRFPMGSDRGEPDQGPVHEVEVDAFLMDRYEVTQEVYGRLDPINGSHFKGPDLPTEMISWGKAALYCNLRSEAEGLELCYNDYGECDFEASGYRLPTEVEWEYACRASSTTPYSYGADSGQLGQYAWFAGNGGKKTHAVGKREPNAWGLYDMHGNVAEWCNDFYDADYYQNSPAENPRGPAESEKNVLRGGHWGASAGACSSAYRYSEEPGFSDACFARDAIGFRCVRNAPPELIEEPASPDHTAVRRSPRDEKHREAVDHALPTAQAGATPTEEDAESYRCSDPLRASVETRVGFVYDELYLRHNAGAGHPEKPERLTAIVARLKQTGLMDQLTAINARPAERKWLTAVHTLEHVDRLRQLCAQGGGVAGTRDTLASGQSYDAAIRAAGGVLAAVDAVMAGQVRSAFCAVRPPGHHALPDKAMGFCLLNNIAIAARYVQQQHKLEKVLIVDWDVHHGNGTQAIFWEDPDVFYFSVHQFPFYPGTGRAEERGAGDGLGTTLNVPLPAGSGDAEFCRALQKQLLPAARKFQPDFVLISAGFDAHADDPLGGMKVTADGYAQLTRIVRQIADSHCQGRLVSVLEGGYDLEGLAASVESHLRVLKEREDSRVNASLRACDARMLDCDTTLRGVPL